MPPFPCSVHRMDHWQSQSKRLCRIAIGYAPGICWSLPTHYGNWSVRCGINNTHHHGNRRSANCTFANCESRGVRGSVSI